MALALVAYGALGAILVWSRTAKLAQPLCCDEIQTVTSYVERGPRAILTGPYTPNNHELYSLFGWSTTSLLGLSPVALRLWSVVPFILGVALVTVWLDRRGGRLAGILYLLLATASPLLIDVSRQARGYGIAFLAMSVLLISALETQIAPRSTLVRVFCVAGTVGSLTLPYFAIAFFTTGAVLVADSKLRRRALIGLGASALLLAAWYAPHAYEILRTPGQNYGEPISTRWLVTAPIDQTLVSAFTQNADSVLRPGAESLVLAVGFAVLVSSSPLLRERRQALILCCGTVATVIVAWLTGADIVARFFSFLLIPLFVLVASGAALILSSRPTAWRTTRASTARVAIALGMLVFTSAVSAAFLTRVTRFPRESLGAVAEAIQTEAPTSTLVYAYVPYPLDLAFHLGRAVERPRTPLAAAAACRQPQPVFFVEQPLVLQAAELQCFDRRGTRHMRFDQYTRGGRVDLWLIPPAAGHRP